MDSMDEIIDVLTYDITSQGFALLTEMDGGDEREYDEWSVEDFERMLKDYRFQLKCPMEEVIDDLVKHGFLEPVTKTYRLTDRGKEAVDCAWGIMEERDRARMERECRP